MTVRVSKPEFNLREKLTELDRPVGLKGNELVRAETTQDARDLVSAGRKNLIINGAMIVAQRGTSYTGTNSYGTVDRMACSHGGTNESPTQAQVDVASGTTPYSLGFRKAFKITNGNQTGGLSAGDLIEAIRYRVEAQDMANSGWNYKSGSSFITLSFWVKSSVSFNMKGYFFHHHGTTQSYPLETGTLTANRWTKIVRTIPGNPTVTFNNGTDVGLTISFGVYGTNFSSSNSPVNQWVTYSAATLTNPSETTWYTTNDATLEFTGLQLEVGPNATEFEHRSFAEELALCQRYYFKTTDAKGTVYPNGGTTTQVGLGVAFPVRMRTTPSVSLPTSVSSNVHNFGAANNSYTSGGQYGSNVDGANFYMLNGNSATAGTFSVLNTNAYVEFSTEL